MDDTHKIMEEKEIKRILSKHNHKVWMASDGRYKTKIDLPGGGTKTIAKTREHDLYNVLIDMYTLKEDKVLTPCLKTLKDIFSEWLEHKSLHVKSTATIKRIFNDYMRFYYDDPISDIPLYELTYYKLDVWAHKMIKDNNLTKKCYYNMSIIFREGLEYCVLREYIDTNPFSEVKVNKKLFKKQKKHDSKKEVFKISEQESISIRAVEKWNACTKSITPLAILLNFQLGLRVGELVSIKWDDIEGNYIHIQRMETTTYCYNEKNNIVTSNGKVVVDYTKSDAGDRTIYLNTNARNILNVIRSRNDKYGYSESGYIFVTMYNTRLQTSSFNGYLYKLCIDCGIIKKSSHKIRKTYISSLFDARLNINKIREIAGHEDERTTLNSYCFDRHDDMETEEILENEAKKMCNLL